MINTQNIRINQLMFDLDLFITILNYIAGATFLLFWFPQIIKTYKSKSAKDISIVSLIFYISGLILSSIYGFYFKQYSYAIPYTLSLIFNITLTCLKIYYDKFYVQIINDKDDKISLNKSQNDIEEREKDGFVEIDITTIE